MATPRLSGAEHISGRCSYAQAVPLLDDAVGIGQVPINVARQKRSLEKDEAPFLFAACDVRSGYLENISILNLRPKDR